MSDPVPNSTGEIDAQRAKRLEEYGKTSSSLIANAPDAVLLPDIGAQLSLGIKQRAKKRVNSTRKTKASLAESLVNVAIAAMLENPCMDMKDMWPVLEELVPGASGDTFQRKLRAKLRELNNADINKILKPRHRKGTVKPSKANQEVGAPVKKPSAKLMEQPSQSADIEATPAQKPKNDDQGDIPKDFLLDLNANSSGF